MLLGPTVNIHRSPLAGRNFECYSEDPYLSAEIAHALISHVQSHGVACCVKHFVCNDSEFERMTISSDVDERTLHEIYLYPFERLVVRTGVWSVMSAYNRVNGVYASASEALLQDILKRAWNFDGVVISDSGGTYSTVEPARAGLDLEMPGPARHMGDKLLAAVREGSVPIDAIDAKVRRHLRLLMRTNRLDAAEPAPERRRSTSHRALIRRVAAEGIVLLKNEGLLPLTNVRRIALIGPNVLEPQVQGGGSSAVAAHYIVDPRAGIAARWPDAAITVARGAVNFKHLPLLPAQQCRVPETDRAGYEIAFYDNLTLAGEPVLVNQRRSGNLIWFGRFSDKVGAEVFRAFDNDVHGRDVRCAPVQSDERGPVTVVRRRRHARRQLVCAVARRFLLRHGQRRSGRRRGTARGPIDIANGRIQPHDGRPDRRRPDRHGAADARRRHRTRV